MIRALLPKDGPTLILMDELHQLRQPLPARAGLATSSTTSSRTSSEEARGREQRRARRLDPGLRAGDDTPRTSATTTRFKKLLDRLGKAIIMSAETEIAEIIRRRLFDWHGAAGRGEEDRRRLRRVGRRTHQQLIGDFDADTASERFQAAYPFHPAVLSVFERKWQSLPRFQRTRGRAPAAGALGLARLPGRSYRRRTTATR